MADSSTAFTEEVMESKHLHLQSDFWSIKNFC